MRKRIWDGRVLEGAKLGALLFVVLGGFSPDAGAIIFNYEVRELTGTTTRNVYGCVQPCPITAAQHDAQPVPAGFEVAPTRVMNFDSGAFTPFAPPPGKPDTLDLFAGIPGPEYMFIAQVLGVTVLQVNSATLLAHALANVKRNTVFTYEAGRVVHEMHDPFGRTYVLMNTTYDFYLANDLSQLGAMAGTHMLPFWTYTSRVLTSDLIVDSGGEATVYVQRDFATWQLLVPEPRVLVLLAFGLLAVAAGRKR
jgi:hypothetical protein